MRPLRQDLARASQHARQDRARSATHPPNLLPIRSGRRGGEGYGFRWVTIAGAIDDFVAVAIARMVLPRGGSSPVRIDRRTSRRVLVIRPE